MIELLPLPVLPRWPRSGPAATLRLMPLSAGFSAPANLKVTSLNCDVPGNVAQHARAWLVLHVVFGVEHFPDALAADDWRAR